MVLKFSETTVEYTLALFVEPCGRRFINSIRGRHDDEPGQFRLSDFCYIESIF